MQLLFKGHENQKPPQMRVKNWDPKKGLEIEIPVNWFDTGKGFISQELPDAAVQKIVNQSEIIASEQPMKDPDEVLHTKSEYRKLKGSKQLFFVYEPPKPKDKSNENKTHSVGGSAQPAGRAN